jgi:nitrite reductase (NADH) small subunit
MDKTVDLGDVERLPLGQGFCFVVKGEEIAVFRGRDGSLFATQNRCPHKNAPLSEGIVGGGTVICPFHARKYDLKTGAGATPEDCLKTWPIHVVDGKAVLTLP